MAGGVGDWSEVESEGAKVRMRWGVVGQGGWVREVCECARVM